MTWSGSRAGSTPAIRPASRGGRLPAERARPSFRLHSWPPWRRSPGVRQTFSVETRRGQRLRRPHVFKIRSLLGENYRPASANRMLAALRAARPPAGTRCCRHRRPEPRRRVPAERRFKRLPLRCRCIRRGNSSRRGPRNSSSQVDRRAQHGASLYRRAGAENRELRRANEILKSASAFFAAELDGRRPR